ncbi:MAG: pilus assembly protein PilP [Holophagaceae bacterium]|nr:pilus assembly protein PilP [Holophagaceae bacterium]
MIRRTLPLTLLFGSVLLAQAPGGPVPLPAPGSAPVEDVGIIKATPYKPVINRDPFSAPRDERPVDALDILDDIAVKGMIRKDGKNFAIISDSRGNIRWLPAGHRFKDAEITAINEKSVTFHQWELNTTNRSIFRTVTKTFKREEGKR